MIDEKFSLASFEACGLNTKEGEKLAELLADEIQKELHKVIETQVLKIIDQLNTMGHCLKLEYPSIPGDISFRDDGTNEKGYYCKLRVGIDTIISTGYAHLKDQKEFIEELNDLEENNKKLEKNIS